jgi:PAS domain S-box-containing protein
MNFQIENALNTISWVTVLWSTVASACFMLGLLHLLTWSQRRSRWAYFFFFLAALGTAGMAIGELWLMRAITPEEYATAARWYHVPVWIAISGLIGFVLTYLRAGRLWLAWTVFGLRTFSLVVNFSRGQNLNYLEVYRLHRVSFLGESVVANGEGVINPWMPLGQLSVFLLLIFVLDATITVWRRGDRKLALTLGTGMVLFLVTPVIQSSLLYLGISKMPMLVSFSFTGIIFFMAWETSLNTLRSWQLEGDLRETQEKYRLLFERSRDAIYLVDVSTGRYLEANQATEELTGRSMDELKRLTIHDVSPKGAGERLARIQDYSGTSMDMGEVEYIQKDGTTRHALLSVTRLKGNAYYGIAHDITESKKSKQALEQQRIQLAHVTRISTMGQLASSLAHELNQPLGAILRNAEAGELILQDPSPDLEELHSILTDIQKDDHRAGEVIDKMRVFMKNREVERRRFDFGLLVHESILLVRPDAERRGILLDLENHPAPQFVHGDRVQLQQVLLNLLINAMDAVNDGPRINHRVSVRVTPVEDTVEVRVTDHGPGIPLGLLPRLFEQYFTTKSNGLGMGLPISRSIVEAHEGRIWAENNPAGGAIFILVLPVAKEGEPN